MATNSKQAHAEKKKASKPQGESAPGLTRAESSEAPHPVATVTDIRNVIEDSKAALAAEEQAALPKRGRGRPPGSTKKTPEFSSPSPAPEPIAGQVQGPEASLAPMVSDALKMYYSQKADETGYEGYRIEPEKADHLGAMADACAEKYFPQMSEKAGLLTITLLSFGMHVLGTEMGYRRFKLAKEVKQEPKPEQVEKKIQSESTMPPVTASDFFKARA